MELTKNALCHSQLSISYKKKTLESDFNWKRNKKEHTEEALYNLPSDNVYLLFVSFCLFHENFGLN